MERVELDEARQTHRLAARCGVLPDAGVVHGNGRIACRAGRFRSVAEAWSAGRWQAIAVPGAPGASSNELLLLSCASPVVGLALDDYSHVGDGSSGLIEERTAR